VQQVVNNTEALDNAINSICSRLNGRSIVLIGLMGAGKTTVGRRLASRLNLPFADADNEIETAAGQTIPEIFEIHGEQYFRDGERRVIDRMLHDGTRVLATGGGAYMNEHTRAAIAKNAVSVWLRAEFSILMKRVRKRSHRPLLKNADPEAVMRKLIAERYPFYERADVVVESREVPHDQIVAACIMALAQYLETAPAART
jgi:shikimate kinase